MLNLGLHNSLSERGAVGAAAGSARLTLFSPYWLNNRTGEVVAGCSLPASPTAAARPHTSSPHAPPANRAACRRADAPRPAATPPCTALPPPAGVDLFYQDHLSAPGQPFLFGAALPWDYGEVFTPGGSAILRALGGQEAPEAGLQGSGWTSGWPTKVSDGFTRASVPRTGPPFERDAAGRLGT